MAQNIHLISSGTVPLPFNTWNPSSPYLDPQLADQVSLGWFKNLKQDVYSISAEGYYKYMKNVTDFADNADIFFNEYIGTEFRQGNSWSYGLELMIKKNLGDFTGFVGYTLSKTERQIPGINNDRTFLANYDRRNVLDIAATYDLSDRWSFGGNFNYSTGRPVTFPSGKYQIGTRELDYITERNGYKLPDYHRIDLAATLTPRKNKSRRMQTNLVFSIYNVYNRSNAFTIYSRPKEDEVGVSLAGQKEFVMIYLFPIIPSVTYNVKF